MKMAPAMDRATIGGSYRRAATPVKQNGRRSGRLEGRGSGIAGQAQGRAAAARLS